MTTHTIAQAQSDSGLLPIAFAALTGLFLVFAAGFSHASAMHDVAHDQRHAIAFPCH
ncbi:MAG: CbtB-domain containing protein [Rhodobacteraceae bacterium]|nr:CbtB-domain containing protein [Paracoccaceae bacterium]